MSASLRLATALSLMGFLAACDKESIDTTINVLRGEPDVAATPEEEHVNETQETEHVPPVMLIPEPEEPPFECVTIWREQTCEDGVLYKLDSNGNWILPGRTE